MIGDYMVLVNTGTIRWPGELEMLEAGLSEEGATQLAERVLSQYRDFEAPVVVVVAMVTSEIVVTVKENKDE